MGAPEPWLAGRFQELDVVPRFLCCSLEHCLRDLLQWTEPLDDRQIWHLSIPPASVGFQLRHIAGSVDRLLTYAKGSLLDDAQLSFMKSETEPGAAKAALLQDLTDAFERTAEFAEALKTEQLREPRYVGRQRLETPLGVLLCHLAEHTQRHTGQAIVLAKLAKAV